MSHRWGHYNFCYSGVVDMGLQKLLEEIMTPTDCKYRGKQVNLPLACGEKHPCNHPACIYMFCENTIAWNDCPLKVKE